MESRGPKSHVQEAMHLFSQYQEGSREGYSFGWGTQLDDATMGLEPENLIIVGGENKAGKTAHAVNTAAVNVRQGNRVLFITTEVTAKQIILRLVCRENKVTLKQIRTPGLLSEEKILECFTTMAGLEREDTLRIADLPHCTIGMVEHEIERAEPDIVIIDHLQRLDPENDNEPLGYKHMSQRLKQLAVEFEIPLMVLSQVRLAQDWFTYQDGEFEYNLRGITTAWSKEPLGEGDKILFLHNLSRYFGGMENSQNIILHALRDYESGGYIPVKAHLGHNWVGSESDYYERYGNPNGPY